MKNPKNYYENILLGSNSQKTIDNAVIQTLPADYHFSSHLHSTVEFFICLDGRCSVTAQQTPIFLEKGDYMVLFPNHSHSFDTPADEGCTILQLHFYPNAFMDFFNDSLEDRHLFFLLELKLDQKKYLKGVCSPQLHTSLQLLYDEQNQKAHNYQIMVDLYLAQILILISRDISHTITNDPIHSNRHILSAYEYLNQHYSEKVTVEDLAEYCGISSRFLTRLFQEHLGMTASTYITYFRINKSIELMADSHNGYSLTQLALEVGFSSPQYYSKVFKDVMNLSPSRYFMRGQ